MTKGKCIYLFFFIWKMIKIVMLVVCHISAQCAQHRISLHTFKNKILQEIVYNSSVLTTTPSLYSTYDDDLHWKK